jgi:hypothetical protein
MNNRSNAKQPCRLFVVGGGLQLGEARGAVWLNRAYLAVDIGGLRWQLCQCRADGAVLRGPIEPGPRQQPRVFIARRTCMR